MIRMIRADFGRIAGRTPRSLIMIVVLLIEAVALFFVAGRNGNTDRFSLGLNVILSVAAFVFGLMELGFVYGDDLKAKSMIVSIGSGVGRSKIVIGKWLETAILLAFDFAAVLVLAYGIGVARHVGLAVLLKPIAKVALKTFTQTLVYFTLSMIFIFLLQTTGIATLAFVLLYFGIINAAISFIANIRQIQWLHLEELTATYFMDHVAQQPFYIVGIVAYLLIAFVISFIIFGNKELEF